MELQGNWIDLLILIFVILYILEGYGRGFVSLLFELVAFLGSFIISLKTYPYLAAFLLRHFSLPQGLANALSFLFLGLILEQVIAHIGVLLQGKIPLAYRKHPINRYLGIVPLFANGVIIVAFLIALLLAFPIQPRIKAAISESRLAKPLISQTQKVERLVTKIFGEAITDTFNFITIEPQSSENVTLHFTQKEVSIDVASETQMLIFVNRERKSQGLKELSLDTKLRDLARVYARDMFERGYFSHYNPEGKSPFDRMDEAGISYQAAGENLAFAPNVGIAHQGLMDSPGHRANILSAEFGKIGIGVIDGGIYGKMFVQEFTN